METEPYAFAPNAAAHATSGAHKPLGRKRRRTRSSDEPAKRHHCVAESEQDIKGDPLTLRIEHHNGHEVAVRKQKARAHRNRRRSTGDLRNYHKDGRSQHMPRMLSCPEVLVTAFNGGGDDDDDDDDPVFSVNGPLTTHATWSPAVGVADASDDSYACLDPDPFLSDHDKTVSTFESDFEGIDDGLPVAEQMHTPLTMFETPRHEQAINICLFPSLSSVLSFATSATDTLAHPTASGLAVLTPTQEYFDGPGEAAVFTIDTFKRGADFTFVPLGKTAVCGGIF